MGKETGSYSTEDALEDISNKGKKKFRLKEHVDFITDSNEIVNGEIEKVFLNQIMVDQVRIHITGKSRNYDEILDINSNRIIKQCTIMREASNSQIKIIQSS